MLQEKIECYKKKKVATKKEYGGSYFKMAAILKLYIFQQNDQNHWIPCQICFINMISWKNSLFLCISGARFLRGPLSGRHAGSPAEVSAPHSIIIIGILRILLVSFMQLIRERLRFATVYL